MAVSTKIKKNPRLFAFNEVKQGKLILPRWLAVMFFNRCSMASKWTISADDDDTRSVLPLIQYARWDVIINDTAKSESWHGPHILQ